MIGVWLQNALAQRRQDRRACTAHFINGISTRDIARREGVPLERCSVASSQASSFSAKRGRVRFRVNRRRVIADRRSAAEKDSPARDPIRYNGVISDVIAVARRYRTPDM